MSSPHSGQRPSDDSSAFMEGGKERVTVFLPNEFHPGENVSLWRLWGSNAPDLRRIHIASSINSQPPKHRYP